MTKKNYSIQVLEIQTLEVHILCVYKLLEILNPEKKGLILKNGYSKYK